MSNTRNDKVIICTMPRGSDSEVAIIIPAPNKHINDCIANIPPECISYRITDRKNLPADRVFRNAWSDAEPGEQVDIDLSKAKEIHKDKLRKLRKPKLEALDLKFMRALEEGDTKAIAKIKSEKQALRDVTKDLAVLNAADVNELKNAIPNALLKD